jgi:hypothetical protein
MPSDSDTLEPVQMFWAGGPLSRLAILGIQSFLRVGHAVHLHVYDEPEKVPAGTTLKNASDIVPRDQAHHTTASPYGIGGMPGFSDYFRYQLLAQHGGWWVDTDVVALRPFVFEQPALTASTLELPYGRVACTYVLRFPPGHPVMQRCLDTFPSTDFSTLEFGKGGAVFLNNSMAALDQKHLMVAPEVFGPVTWQASWQLTRSIWQRFSSFELKQRLRRPHLNVRFRRETVAVHLWNETWRNAGRDPDGTFPRSCLLERLRRMVAQPWDPSRGVRF